MMVPGNRQSPHAQEIARRELKPDSEHQEDDAKVGELRAERLVGDETGRVGPDDDAGDQIADERGEPEPVGERSKDKG